MFLIYFLSFVFILIGVLIAENKKVYKFKKTTYYQITNNDYYQVLFNKGLKQEYFIYEYLKDIEKLDGKFLFNLYIPKNRNETTEIDIVLICKKGIFVFESKNYRGLILGNENYKNWIQMLINNRGEKEKYPFYNPIFQNNNHIYYLTNLLKHKFKIFSFIVFSDNCKLLNIKIQNSNTNLLQMADLKSKFCEIYNNNKDVFTKEQINRIYEYLYPYTKVSNKIKARHYQKVKQIKEKNTYLYSKRMG